MRGHSDSGRMVGCCEVRPNADGKFIGVIVLPGQGRWETDVARNDKREAEQDLAALRAKVMPAPKNTEQADAIAAALDGIGGAAPVKAPSNYALHDNSFSLAA